MDAKIGEADVATIAGNLPSWQEVGTKLGIGTEAIRDIENKYRDPQEWRKAVLREWIWKNGAAATYSVMYNVLLDLHERGAAGKIAEIAVSQVSKIISKYKGIQSIDSHKSMDYEVLNLVLLVTVLLLKAFKHHMVVL